MRMLIVGIGALGGTIAARALGMLASNCRGFFRQPIGRVNTK